MNRREQALHIAVARYLRLALPREAVWWHTPNGGWRSKAEAGILKEMGVLPGLPDLFIVWRGLMFGLELKDPQAKTAKADPHQAAVHRDLEAAGVRILTANDLDAIDDWLHVAMPMRARVGAVARALP